MYYRFPAPIVLEVSGKDSVRYLNSRLSNDLRNTVVGSSVRGAALTAQGKVEGIFTVHPLEDSSFRIVCDGGSLDEVVAAFKRYIVADRVSVVDVSEKWTLFHTSTIPDDLFDNVLFQSNSFKIRRISVRGLDILLPLEKAGELSEYLTSLGGREIGYEEYTLRRFEMGFPTFPEEVNDDASLTEYGMREIVSFTKGCYVGQEVIESTDAIGRVPRKLERLLLSGEHSISAGSSVTSLENGEIGKVVSSIKDHKQLRTLCFVLLRNGRYAHGDGVKVLEIEGQILLQGTSLDEQ